MSTFFYFRLIIEVTVTKHINQLHSRGQRQHSLPVPVHHKVSWVELIDVIWSPVLSPWLTLMTMIISPLLFFPKFHTTYDWYTLTLVPVSLLLQPSLKSALAHSSVGANDVWGWTETLQWLLNQALFPIILSGLYWGARNYLVHYYGHMSTNTNWIYWMYCLQVTSPSAGDTWCQPGVGRNLVHRKAPACVACTY